MKRAQWVERMPDMILLKSPQRRSPDRDGKQSGDRGGHAKVRRRPSTLCRGAVCRLPIPEPQEGRFRFNARHYKLKTLTSAIPFIKTDTEATTQNHPKEDDS